MPSSDALDGAPDDTHRTIENRLLPYGGDKAVAQSMAQCHRRRPWTARCVGCGECWPCRDRIDAERVLRHREGDADA